ncbi:hypothetical protein PR048_012166 [Dryococelus australis]|uniref:Uncharacterized protein n=1 Tax=Dryococelus australis TaxID=614101 RepID=A0ABQ9HNK5_9NEOP|nr:hypothetical protein PR048_012166 [Dryococelus australis]
MERGVSVTDIRCIRPCSPPTMANRVQSPAVSPDFRKWESCQTMPFVGEYFSRGSSVSPALSFRRCSILTSISLIVSQDLAVKSRPNLVTLRKQIMCCSKESEPKQAPLFRQDFRQKSHSSSFPSEWPPALRLDVDINQGLREFWTALKFGLLRADEGVAKLAWSSVGMQGRGNGRSPRKPADQRHRVGSDLAETRTWSALVGGELSNRCTAMASVQLKAGYASKHPTRTHGHIFFFTTKFHDYHYQTKLPDWYPAAYILASWHLNIQCSTHCNS